MNNRKSKGFTLVELLAVITILSVLVLLAIPMVTRQVENSRKMAFAESATRAVSAVHNYILKDRYSDNEDMSINEECNGTLCVFTLEKINKLLDKKLTTSPFGIAYDSQSSIVVQENASDSKDNYTYFVCLFDLDKNGFSYTPSSEIKSESITTGVVNTCGSYTSRTLVIKTTGGEIPDTEGFTVSSDRLSAQKLVEYEQPYGTLPELTWTGHTFDGWYTEKDQGTKIESDSIVTGTNYTLYAHWTDHSYTVKADLLKDDATFKNNNGWTGKVKGKPYTRYLFGTGAQYTLAKSKAYCCTSTLPTINANAGTFSSADATYQLIKSGLYCKHLGGNRGESCAYTASTYYERITAKKDSSGTVFSSQRYGAQASVRTNAKSKQVTYGEKYGTLPVPNPLADYEFVGWFTESNGGTQITADTIMNKESAHTIYAHWVSTLPQ